MAISATKGAGSVEMGITFLQNHKIYVHPSCKNAICEFENYVYLKDKRTGQLSDKTDHTYSHFMDALRYSYSDLYTAKTVRVMSKSLLGL